MDCKQIITYAANGKGYTSEKQLPVTLEADEARHLESGVINIYPQIEYQTIEGFGGAMTETSAYLFMTLAEDVRKEALGKFFGKGSSGVKFLRVHMDSCDYSLEEYQAVENPLEDPELKTFSLKRDQKYILPMLKEAIALSEHTLSVLLSPWSPPKQWKTPPARPKNDMSTYGGLMRNRPEVDYDNPSRCNGGSLKPEYYGIWAKYMVKFVQAYLDEGIPVTMLSVQNEAIAATNWDSCVWEPEQEKIFLRDYLFPELQAQGLAGKVGLYFWDHNKERILERAMDMIDDDTFDMIEGIAFHWYSGDHFEAVKMTQEKFPTKTLMLSECCGLHQPGRVGFGGGAMFGAGSSKTPETVDYEDAVNYAHDIIGNLNAGMNRWIDWNLCVDKDGGPRHVPGGFTASMIVYDDGTYNCNLTYDFICHFSKYILPGAKRIGFSRCNDKVDMTAAKNPDGSVVAVILNKTNEDTGYAFRMEGKVIRVSLPARTLSTFVIG